MKRLIYFLLFSLCLFSRTTAGEMFHFRVYLTDKGYSEFNMDNPETFLSQKAIERRDKQGKQITVSDLPISPVYIDNLIALGGELVTKSKWQSTVVLASRDSLLREKIQKLNFVDSVKWVWKGKAVQKAEKLPEKAEKNRLMSTDSITTSFYGYAKPQIEMLNGIKLHKKGFTGEGIQVAIIDAGFSRVDRINAFDSLRLAGTYNFVEPAESVFEGDEHGTRVLSCMAAYLPGIMVGTAPHATYWLLKSEDSRSEYPIEEDYWAAAVEFADSVGVDVISSSLGYFHFDADEMNYDQEALNGKTAFISRVASQAAEKGILVFCSAGNEGGGSWEKITFPSDADNILTIGSINQQKEKSNFSSTGFTSDFRVKPDVVALGSGSCVIDSSGNVRYSSGTSFATPILAGLGVCLWHALPTLSNTEIIMLLQESASQYKRPDIEKGYGIPNLYKAYKKGKKYAK